MADNLDGSTYVQVDDINDVNYISEGFLSRYSFTLKPKGTGFWSKLGKVVLGVAVVAVVAAATVVTAGTAASINSINAGVDVIQSSKIPNLILLIIQMFKQMQGL